MKEDGWMKRILQVVPDLDLNGVANFNMNNYRELKDECQFDFMVMPEYDSPHVAEVEALGGHVYCSGPTELRHIGRFLKRAVSIMKEHGPYDVVHSQMTIANGWILLAAAIAGVPVRIAHSHGTNGREGSPLVRLYREMLVVLMKLLSTRALACGQTAGEYLFGKRYFAKHGTVILNGIDTARFACVPEEAIQVVREECSISEDCPLVIENISRFCVDKNPLFSVEVFAEVLKLEPRAILILGGPDLGLLEATKARISELGIGEHVRLLGRRSDIPACLKVADVYLFPSLFEGLGIVLLEAQAAGLLCMASDRVPREVDLGLGSVMFEALETSPAIWAKTIVEQSRNRVPPSTDVIFKTFSATGY